MLKRKERRWQYLSLEEVKKIGAALNTETIWHDAIHDPLMVTSSRLAGKDLTFRFEDGLNMSYVFQDKNHLRFETSDGRQGAAFYNLSPAPGYENFLFLHHCCEGEIPACIDLLMDFDTGYAVLFDASLGHPGSPREVIRKIRFGTIDGVTPSIRAEKPHFTNDLTGRAIRWRRAGMQKGGIKYIFTSCNYLTYVMKFRDTNECWVGTNPCDYIKFRDDLYLCSTIEERQTGVELIMVMNLSMLTDVQSIFGIGGTTEQGIRLETSMHSGRAGSWEEMPTDLFHDEAE